MNQALDNASPAPVGARGARMLYGDPIRIVGTFAVVLGHSADMWLFGAPREGFHLSFDWWVANIFNCLARFAVPCYLMLSGALLLPSRGESPQTFYRKRLARIGLPLLFWSVFFTLFGVFYTKWVTPEQAIMNLAKGQPYAHMYFIFSIAGLYAFTPMLRVFLAHVSRPMLVGTVVLLLALECGDSVLRSLSHTELNAFTRFVPFIGYYLAGYLLRDVRLTPRGVAMCAIGWIALVALLAGGTAGLSTLAVRQWANEGGVNVVGPPSTQLMLYDFLSPVRIPLSICAWLVLTHVFRERWYTSPRGSSAVGWFAALTLGIYLVHPALREIFIVNGFGYGSSPSVLGIPLLALLTYVSSAVVAIVIWQIPYVRRIMG